jgi:hypothetical protein
MNPSIFERVRDAISVLGGTIRPRELVPIYGEWLVKVVRHDGTVEEFVKRNLVTAAGLNRIANRAVQATGTTPLFNVVIGSRTNAAALTDVQSNMGEMGRKNFVAAGASAQSREWIFGTATFAGAADGITSLTIDCCALSDHPNSHATTGIIANLVTGLAVTLGNSDFLNLTPRIRVGSHDVSHST